MSIIELALKTFQKSGQARAEESPLGSIRETPVIPPLAKSSSGNEVEHAVSRRMVHLDRNTLIDAGFLPPEHRSRQFADQFRHAKRPLLRIALDRGANALPNGQLIMLASSFPGEGKSFISVNLAFSMSMERNVSVVLVDADVAKAHISRQFGVESEPGLLEALQFESLEVESLILPTNIPNLSVLPAGKPIDTATELLASDRMQQVVSELGTSRDRKRIVIFDSPPLLLTSESRVLAQLMGQIVLVVQAGVTPRQAVMDSIHCLGERKLVFLLLNQSASISKAGYYHRDGAYGEYTWDTENRAAEAPGSTP